MTHHRAKRDPSTGRFIKPTPLERVAAHVEAINTAHPGHWSDCAVNSEPAYPAGECDCGGYNPQDDSPSKADLQRIYAGQQQASAAYMAKMMQGAQSAFPRAAKPERSQPIEYATPRHLIRWEILGMEIGD
jgi:hypothetical protein